MNTHTFAKLAGLSVALAIPSESLARDGKPDPEPLIDLPGMAPAPKSSEEASKPAAEQTGAAKPATTADAGAPTVSTTRREWFGPGHLPWTEWSRATGDWGGARTAMEDAGLTIGGSFTFDWSSVYAGGLERRAYTRRLLDLNATLDLEKAFEWTGGSVFIDFQHYSGFTGNAVGDVIGTDIWSTPNQLDQIMELWFQQVLFDGGLRIKAGKIDANLEFATLPSTLAFVSANGYWDSNLIGQPTYPDPATGVVVYAYPTDRLYLGAGVFDGATAEGLRTGGRGPATFFSDDQADSWYFAGEAGLTWESLGGMHAGRLGVGGWGHTAEFDRLNGSGVKDGTQGGYIIAQQQLTRRGEGDALKSKGLYAFGRASFADRSVSLLETKLTCGLVLQGTFAGRDADEAGVMFSYGFLSDAASPSGDETNLELFYKLQLFGSVSITPDLQWIRNPSGAADVEDAWLGTLRVVVKF